MKIFTSVVKQIAFYVKVSVGMFYTSTFFVFTTRFCFLVTHLDGLRFPSTYLFSLKNMTNEFFN